MSGDKPKAGPPKRDPTGPTPPSTGSAKASGFLPNSDTEADVLDPAALRAALGKPERSKARPATARGESPAPRATTSRGEAPAHRATTSRGETPAPRATTSRGESPEPPGPERPTNPSGFDPDAVFNPGDAVTTVGVIDPALLKALLARNSEPPEDPVVSRPALASRTESAGALLGRAGRVSAPPTFGGDTEMADLAALEADISARHQGPKIQDPATLKTPGGLDSELAAVMALAADEVERPKGAAPPKVSSNPDRPAVPPPPKPGAPPKSTSSPDRPAPAAEAPRAPLAPPRLDSDLQRVMASAAASVEIESPGLASAPKRATKAAKSEPGRPARKPKRGAAAEERRSYAFEIGLAVLAAAAVGAELKLHLSWPTVALTSRPSPAKVLVGEVEAGQTPLALKLEPGVDHRVVLQADGHPDTVRRVLLSRFERSELVVDLDVAQRFVVAPGPVEVFVNERSVGRGQKVRLPTLRGGEAITIRVEHEERVVLERTYGDADEVEDEITIPGL